MQVSYDRILVTGGAGFIGSHTVDALLNANVATWVLDDLSSGLSGNLSKWTNDKRLHIVRGSVTDARTIRNLAKRVDGIIHLAAQVSPFVSMRTPEITDEVNVDGTLNVLRAGIAERLQRIVYASSSSVYGELKSIRMRENQPTTPITPYGVSKLAAEKYCQAFFRSYGLPTVSLRYFNVYGQRQSANPYSGVIAIFAKTLMRGRRPKIYGSGVQTRDFIHVSDVVRANLLALECRRGAGETFNVGTQRATSIKQLYRLLARLSNKQGIRPIIQPRRLGDIKNSCADISKARSLLKFKPVIELEAGLESLLTSFRTE